MPSVHSTGACNGISTLNLHFLTLYRLEHQEDLAAGRLVRPPNPIWTNCGACHVLNFVLIEKKRPLPNEKGRGRL